MQPFEENATCWKCGKDEIGATYCPGAMRGRTCWRSSIGLTQAHMHRKCSYCGHFWFEDVREAGNASPEAERDREADAALGALVRRMPKSGMALYRTEHLNWSIRVWNKSEKLWTIIGPSDSPESLLRKVIADLRADELE